MEDYVQLQNWCKLSTSLDSLKRIHTRFQHKDFNLQEETTKRHVQYNRNPLHYIVTSQVSNDTLLDVFFTLIKDRKCVQHRDQVYGRYPIHYAATSLHYKIRCSRDATLFLIELGRLSYCGFNDKDTVYGKSVRDYIDTTLCLVMSRMYDNLAYKIQKWFRMKQWRRVVKQVSREIEALPPKGPFPGGIEFKRLQANFSNLQVLMKN